MRNDPQILLGDDFLSFHAAKNSGRDRIVVAKFLDDPSAHAVVDSVPS